jgi:hypothetical protein
MGGRRLGSGVRRVEAGEHGEGLAGRHLVGWVVGPSTSLAQGWFSPEGREYQ